MTVRRAPTFRFGIGGRLIAAFLSVGSLAAGACLVGWLSYARLSQELGAIAEAHLPALALSVRLAEAGAKVIASAPDLALAEDTEGYERVRGALAERMQSLRTVLGERTDRSLSTELHLITDAIAANLDTVDKVVSLRFPLDQQARTIADELRWLQADLIEEIEPLIEDARFNIEVALSRQEEANDGKAIREENRRSEALLMVNAQANLVVGLLGRLTTVRTSDDLEQTVNFLGESVDQFELETKALAGSSDNVTVHQIAARLIELSDIRSGLPALKRMALSAAREGQNLLAENRRLVTALGTLISQEVTRTEAVAHDAAERSSEAIRIGRNLLAAIAVASFIAFVIGLAYIHRNLLQRLQTLTLAATNIAGGSSFVTLPPPTDDELGDLSRALSVFRQTRDELIQAAKLAALGQMVAGLGHELNQPLAAIRFHAHNGALQLERGQSDGARANLNRIQALTTRMAELITHLKRFSRRPDVKLGPVDLHHVVDGALSLFGRQFENNGIEVEVVLPDHELQVRAEEIRLEQVVVNLLSNASDALRNQKVRRIALTAKRDAGRVTLLVSDTGPGIPDEHRTAIFDPFFTTKSVGAGLGLGLSMSYNIVKDFGGTLSIFASSATGTTFSVELVEAA